MPDAWLVWWSILCVATVINVAAWLFSARRLRHREAFLPADVYATRKRLLLLSAVYVVGCGFRSVLPMVDVPRICLHDTGLSRIFIGRSVATIAEICFAAQWALLLREAAAAVHSGPAKISARTLIPIIVAAEIFSWLAVLTTNNLLHAAENSLWTLAATLAVASLISIRQRLDRKSRVFLATAIVCGAAYIAFMAIVDVPMYLSRWQTGLASGQEYLSLHDGIRELLRRCTVSRDWAAWRDDVSWLTLYFTVAVWISIGLPHAPPLRSRPCTSVQ